jgi:hypothetical protein
MSLVGSEFEILGAEVPEFTTDRDKMYGRRAIPDTMAQRLRQASSSIK